MQRQTQLSDNTHEHRNGRTPPDPFGADLFRLLVENLKDHAAFTTDPTGVITSWNTGAERLLGYQEAEIIGKHASILFTPEDIQAGVPQWELETARTEG